MRENLYVATDDEVERIEDAYIDLIEATINHGVTELDRYKALAIEH